MSLRKKLLDTFGAQVSSDHERYPADVKCLGFLYLYVGRYPRNNASRNTVTPSVVCSSWRNGTTWWCKGSVFVIPAIPPGTRAGSSVTGHGPFSNRRNP